MKNQKLIYKIAWNFQKKTGIQIEDLISEASLGYAEALNSYRSEKNNNFPLYAWRVMHNQLINYIGKHFRTRQNYKEDAELPVVTKIDPIHSQTAFNSQLNEWPNDCRYIADMVIHGWDDLGRFPPKKARGKIISRLRNEGWSWPRIWQAVRDVKGLLRQTDFDCII